eukprot:CAMPEP_0172461188 /NCGR_PEP_ID=MMETSP1065-20121228/39604_1 /TAXON_ID=265537 /ORGANISM="Amphiprora paludosa, Strain CCMP125" /LENGTH=213 /DNA_ID=CAMNT_0013216431 /DNA_START=24 /DNA_END=665 /DNA_ORIENTATION=+
MCSLLGASAWTSEPINRRNAFSKAIAVPVAAAGSLVIAGSPVEAAESGLALAQFQDPKTGIKVKVPSDWIASVQQLPDRRTVNLWMDPKDPKSLVFIAFTPIRDDFTSLGSFGSVDQVAVQTILPKGQLAGVDVDAKMLSAVSAKQSYLFDYLQTVPNVQPTTHFRTIFTLQQGATGGAGSVLVTVTAQTPEERYSTELEGAFNQIIDSFAKA